MNRRLASIYRSEELCLAFRLVLGGVFVWAAVHKISDPGLFARDVANFQLLPTPLVYPLSLFLPWLELLAGVSLILGPAARGAAAAVAGMLVMFLVAVSLTLVRGIDVQCGCFSSSEEARHIGAPLLLQDAGLLLLSIHVWIRGAGRWAIRLRSRATHAKA